MKKTYAWPFLIMMAVLLIAGTAGCTAGEPQGAGQPAGGAAESPQPADPAESGPATGTGPSSGQSADQTGVGTPDAASGQSGEPSPDAQTSAEAAAEEPASGGRDAGGEPSIFSLKIGDAVISVGDWDDQVDLEAILGPPSEQETTRLENADTHTGSFLKKLTYDGLEIDLFSPSGNGETFWILTMRVSKEGIPTSAGIEVGSTLDEALAAYPGMERVSNIRDDDQVYRLYSHSQYEYVEVVVRDGLVTAINVSGSL